MTIMWQNRYISVGNRKLTENTTSLGAVALVYN